MKLKDLKYGFLISASTLFGGSSLSLYAQTNNTTSQKIETVSNYKKQFLESIGADKDKISVDFMVDSVASMVSHGDLVADVNVIELLAYLEPDSEEYQSYLANKHIVAHEMWHRICLMKGVLEQPMSATQFRKGLDNFEITASILPVLTFRDDYIHAGPKEREAMMKSPDPKIEMYVQAIKHDIVRPLSLDKKDFDFEMQFIAVMVSNFWNNNMTESYANYHNSLTYLSGRKEFNTPVYDKNFNHDIKIMNTIGGIDFSKYYNVTASNPAGVKFPLSEKADTVVLNRRLNTPDYETWVNKKSKLKRYSKQNVEIPNFAGDILVKEREARPYDKRVQPYTIAPYATGYKTYPKATTFFKTAIELKKQDKTYKFYPNGSLDEISPGKAPGTETIITYNIDGSSEKGQLFQGRKNGVFTYYDKDNKQIGSCTFKNGRPQDGVMLSVFQQKRFYYTYKTGNLINVECQNFLGKKLSTCLINEEKPVLGMMPKDVRFSDMMFDVYEKGEKISTVTLNDDAKITDRIIKKENTVKIERFYADGTPHYAAKITPFKKVEVLYDEKAKPVIIRNKINQKLYLKGNIEKLEQEIRLSPLEISDKKLILNHLTGLLNNTDSKVISPKGPILMDLPLIYDGKVITNPYIAVAQTSDKTFVSQITEAMIAFHPVNEQVQIKSAPTPLESEIEEQKPSIIKKMFSLFIPKENAPRSLPLQQNAPAVELVSDVSLTKKSPRFLWRKFSFSPRALTTSISEPSNHFTLFNKRTSSVVQALKPVHGKKIVSIPRFQNGFKLASSKKILNMFKSRALSNQKFNASLLKARYLSGKHRG